MEGSRGIAHCKAQPAVEGFALVGVVFQVDDQDLDAGPVVAAARLALARRGVHDEHDVGRSLGELLARIDVVVVRGPEPLYR